MLHIFKFRIQFDLKSYTIDMRILVCILSIINDCMESLYSMYFNRLWIQNMRGNCSIISEKYRF